MLLFFSLNGFAAEINKCSLRRAEESLKSIRQTTFTGKLFEKYILANSPELAEIFRDKGLDIKFARNNPEDLLMIKGTFCRSIALTWGICAKEMEKENERENGIDDETDAIRHYIASAIMACNRSQKYAAQIMTAHEGNPPWARDSQMDIHNNFVGIEWADPKFSRCQRFSEIRVVKSALQALAEGKLVTLTKEDGPCSNPKKILAELNNLSDEAFYEKIKTSHLKLKKRISNCK